MPPKNEIHRQPLRIATKTSGQDSGSGFLHVFVGPRERPKGEGRQTYRPLGLCIYCCSMMCLCFGCNPIRPAGCRRSSELGQNARIRRLRTSEVSTSETRQEATWRRARNEHMPKTVQTQDDDYSIA